jgi:hypothetical protein
LRAYGSLRKQFDFAVKSGRVVFVTIVALMPPTESGVGVASAVGWVGFSMSESVETEERVLESGDAQALPRFGPLFVLVFVINVAIAVLAWLLVGLLT